MRSLRRSSIQHIVDIQLLDALAELRKATISFVMSVRLSSLCPHGTTPFPLDRFSSNIILEFVSKICRENSNFIQIEQK